MRNSIRPAAVASLLGKGEAQMTHGPAGRESSQDDFAGKPDGLKTPDDASGRQGVVGDRMVGRFDSKQGGLPEQAETTRETVVQGGPQPKRPGLGPASGSRGDTNRPTQPERRSPGRRHSVRSSEEAG